MKNVIELKNSLITHKLSILRDKNTSTKEFRELVKEIAMFLCYEAMSKAELDDTEIETPVTKYKTKKLNQDKFAFVPILRAGMGMLVIEFTEQNKYSLHQMMEFYYILGV